MYKPTIGLLVLATALLAMLLVACGGGEEPTAPAAAGQSAATPTVEAMMEEATPTPEPTPTATPTPAPPLNVYESGQTIPDFPLRHPQCSKKRRVVSDIWWRERCHNNGKWGDRLSTVTPRTPAFPGKAVVLKTVASPPVRFGSRIPLTLRVPRPLQRPR